MNEVHIVMRSEEHDDYIEAVFENLEEAIEYIRQFNKNDYARHVETWGIIKQTPELLNKEVSQLNYEPKS